MRQKIRGGLRYRGSGGWGWHLYEHAQHRVDLEEPDLEVSERARRHVDVLRHGSVSRRLDADGHAARRRVGELEEPVGIGSGLAFRFDQGDGGRADRLAGALVGDQAQENGRLLSGPWSERRDANCQRERTSDGRRTVGPVRKCNMERNILAAEAATIPAEDTAGSGMGQPKNYACPTLLPGGWDALRLHA